MSIFDTLFRRRPQHEQWDSQIIREEPKEPIRVGVESNDRIEIYNTKNFMFNGEVKDINYNALMFAPQQHIQDIWNLCYFFSNADPVVHSIIYNCMVPYLCGAEHYLDGSNKKTVKLFDKYYKDIRLEAKLQDIITELSIFACSFVYLYNGKIITLPHSRMRISNIKLDGLPICEFNVSALRESIQPKSGGTLEEYIDAHNRDAMLSGWPPEVRDAVFNGKEWCQMNPRNMFCIQLPKVGFEKYSIPWIVSAFSALQNKEYIKLYEKAQLELGACKLIHIKYGDEKASRDLLPDRNQLTAIQNIFKAGFKNGGLATTNCWANAEVLNKDIGDMYDNDLYSATNNQICSAAGIAPIIASGISETGSSFSTASVATNALEVRLTKILESIAELMDKLNERFVEYMDAVYNLKEIPKWKYKPISMIGSKALREEALTLYKEQVLSRDTLLDKYGYDYKQELEQIAKEPKQDDGTKTNNTKTNIEETDNNVGRPVLDDGERVSDPSNSISGNPESKVE